jgi:hypothetical protein
MVKTKLIIPEIPDARKLPCREGKPACVKIMGAKYRITSIYVSDDGRGNTPVSCWNPITKMERRVGRRIG